MTVIMRERTRTDVPLTERLSTWRSICHTDAAQARTALEHLGAYRGLLRAAADGSRPLRAFAALGVTRVFYGDEAGEELARREYTVEQALADFARIAAEADAAGRAAGEAIRLAEQGEYGRAADVLAATMGSWYVDAMVLWSREDPCLLIDDLRASA